MKLPINKATAAFGVLLLMALTCADFQAEYEHLGYGTVSTGGDTMLSTIMMSGIFILAGVAFIWMAMQMKEENHERS